MSRQQLSDVTRAALIEAAVVEFAAHGFEGASTRAIAQRAGVHQPQINYHFESKLELWRAAIDHLFAELDAESANEVRPGMDDVAALAAGIRAFVRHAARRPELNRMMVKESSVESERLTWLVDTYVRDRLAFVDGLWTRLRAEGRVHDIDSLTAFYMLLGGGTLLYTNAPEARLLTGVDPTDPARIEAHASALIAMLTVTTHTTRRKPR